MLPTRRLSTKRGAGVQKLGEGYANKVKKNKKYVLDKKNAIGSFLWGWEGGLVWWPSPPVWNFRYPKLH